MSRDKIQWRRDLVLLPSFSNLKLSSVKGQLDEKSKM